MPEDLLTALARAAPFQGLDQTTLAAVLAAARQRVVPAGRLFFREGEPARWLYVLVDGRVKLTQTGLDGHRVIVRLVGPGDLFGGIAALAETVYPASAEALEASQALAWSGPAIERLFRAHPQIAINVLRHLAQRVLELQDRLRELSTERVERRLARAVLRLLALAGQPGPEGVWLGLALSRQELAELIGTTLYTVSRILSRWEREGWVMAGRERLLVRAPQRLQALAEGLSDETPLPPPVL
jgi:CRP-like cAMP-binding protein